MSTTTLLPDSTITLFELSWVDLIDTIERSDELSDDDKRHWICSLRQIAKGMDRPLAVIPARWSANQPIASRAPRRHSQDLGQP